MKLLQLCYISIIILVMFLGCDSKSNSNLFAVPYQPHLDISREMKDISVDNLSVKVDVTRPLIPFKHLFFSFQFLSKNQAVSVQTLQVAYNMKMDMGKLTYIPEKQNDGYLANVVIPKCLTGDNRWYGKLTFTYQGKSYEKVFIFDMEQ